MCSKIYPTLRIDSLQYDHRHELNRVKADMNELLFIAKKESLDKDAHIRMVERKLEAQKNRSPVFRPGYSSPAPCTPVMIRKYNPRPKTPSNIPRLLVVSLHKHDSNQCLERQFRLEFNYMGSRLREIRECAIRFHFRPQKGRHHQTLRRRLMLPELMKYQEEIRQHYLTFGPPIQ